jgi:hypothetical protein
MALSLRGYAVVFTKLGITGLPVSRGNTFDTIRSPSGCFKMKVRVIVHQYTSHTKVLHTKATHQRLTLSASVITYGETDPITVSCCLQEYPSATVLFGRIVFYIDGFWRFSIIVSFSTTRS